MKHIKAYKIFELMFKLDTIANQFITDMSKVYNLRFGESFDKNKANCAWFTGEFYKWAKSKDLNVKVVYFDSNIEAHIAPMIDDKVIDFAIKQFTKNPNDNYLILIPEDYKKYGYDKFEIYDEMPKLETIFSADKLFESYPYNVAPNKFEIKSEIEYKKLEPDVKDILLELNDIGIKSTIHKHIDDSIFEFQIEITLLKTPEQKQMCQDSLLRLEDFLSEHDLHLAKIEMEQLILNYPQQTESHDFDLYDMSELENLKGTAGIISLLVYFSKIRGGENHPWKIF